MRLSLEVPPLIFNVYQRRRFVCVRLEGGGAKSEFKTAALVLKCTSSNSLTCAIVVIFVGVGKMNVNPLLSLQVPPPIG